MAVQENIAAYKDAMASVAAHCMAAKVERAAGRVTIYYPIGYFPNGCRVLDSAHGLWQAVEVMERHWLESFPSGNGMEVAA